MSFELPKKPTRRQFLKGLGMAAGGLAAGGTIGYLGKEVQEKDEEIPEMIEGSPNPLLFLDVPQNPKSYPTGELAGSKSGGLLTDYTGISGVVPPEARIDFRFQLACLWAKKFHRMSGAGPYRQSAVEGAHKIFDSYDSEQPNRTDLLQYRHYIDRVIGQIRPHIPLEHITQLGEFSKLHHEQVELLKEFERSIDGSMLLSIAITELMPGEGQTASLGVATLDFLLRNAGSDFVERIPAVYDKLFSFGPYQFTSIALLDEGARQHGASMIAHLSKEKLIHDTVSQLSSYEHHRAAYLLAIYNLGHLVGKLGVGRSKILLAHRTELPEGLMQEFVASAHHLPAEADAAFVDFADAFIASKKSHGTHHQKVRHEAPDFLKQCQKYQVGIYCSKMRDNRRALENRLQNLKSASR